LKRSRSFDDYLKRNNKKSRDTVMSRAKFTRSARRTVHLYVRSKVKTSRDYQISITAEPIELIISSIDNAYPNYIMKVYLFLRAVGKSYYNVKCRKKIRSPGCMYVCTVSIFRR